MDISRKFILSVKLLCITISVKLLVTWVTPCFDIFTWAVQLASLLFHMAFCQDTVFICINAQEAMHFSKGGGSKKSTLESSGNGR